jgi:hypothetical protein
MPQTAPPSQARESGPSTVVTFRVPFAVRARLDQRADTLGVSLSDVVRRALERELTEPMPRRRQTRKGAVST